MALGGAAQPPLCRWVAFRGGSALPAGLAWCPLGLVLGQGGLTAFMAVGVLMCPMGGGEAWSTVSGGGDRPARLGGVFTLKPTDNLDTGKREARGGGQRAVARWE